MRASRPRAPAADNAFWSGERSRDAAAAGISATLALLHWKLPFLLLWVAAFVLSGFIYTKLLRPDYIATTQVLLKPRIIVNDGPEDVRHFHQFMIDSQQCETELRVLRSEQLLYRVFNVLNLDASPEVRNGPDGLWSYVGAKASRIGPLIAFDGDDVSAFYAFASRVRARRLGLSYVIEISYRAQSAQQAVRVANAIAVAYAAHRLRGVVAREQRSGVYTEGRAKSLSTQLLAADAGMRYGTIPESGMPDTDVRLLGTAALPLRSSYPKQGPLLAMMAGLGAVSGLLIVLLPQAAPRRARPGDLIGRFANRHSASRPLANQHSTNRARTV